MCNFPTVSSLSHQSPLQDIIYVWKQMEMCRVPCAFSSHVLQWANLDFGVFVSLHTAAKQPSKSCSQVHFKIIWSISLKLMSVCITQGCVDYLVEFNFRQLPVLTSFLCHFLVVLVKKSIIFISIVPSQTLWNNPFCLVFAWEVNYTWNNAGSHHSHFLQKIKCMSFVPNSFILHSFRLFIFQPITNNNPWMLLYFISFLLIVSFFVLNMFVGVVVENFHKCRQHQEVEEAKRREEKRLRRMEKKRRSKKEKKRWEAESMCRRNGSRQ